MDIYQSLALFLMMLVAQVPLAVSALVGYLKNKTAVEQVHKTINSKLDDRLLEIEEATKVAVEAAYARGRHDERTKQPEAR